MTSPASKVRATAASGHLRPPAERRSQGRDPVVRHTSDLAGGRELLQRRYRRILRSFLVVTLAMVGVVYLTGAAGNTAHATREDNPQRARPWYGEDGWRRCGTYMGAEMLKVIASTTEPMAEPEIRLAQAVEQDPDPPLSNRLRSREALLGQGLLRAVSR